MKRIEKVDKAWPCSIHVHGPLSCLFSTSAHHICAELLDMVQGQSVGVELLHLIESHWG